MERLGINVRQEHGDLPFCHEQQPEKSPFPGCLGNVIERVGTLVLHAEDLS